MDRRPIQNFTYDWSFFLFAGDKLVYECIENQVKNTFSHLVIAWKHLLLITKKIYTKETVKRRDK